MILLTLTVAAVVAGALAVALTARFAEIPGLEAVADGMQVTDANSPPKPAPAGKQAVIGLSFAGVLLAVALGTRSGAGGSLFWIVPVIGALWLPLAVIDLTEMRLPRQLAFALMLLTPAALAIVGATTGTWHIEHALIGALIWWGFLTLLYLLTAGRALGYGDLRVAPSLGLVLGWVGIGPSIAALFVAFAVGSVVGVAGRLTGRSEAKQEVPFGPFLIIGAAVGLAVGPQIAHWYTSFTGIG